MSEEEKQVLKTFKSGLGLTSAEREILVNYIDKLQKEIDKIRQVEIEVIKENTMFSEKIDEQSRIIDKLQKENQELKEKYENINWYFENQKENFISKEKIRKIIYPSPDNMIPLEVQTSDMYRKLNDLVKE